MRDHNYHSRMKNCQVWFVLTVDNEKSLCEKKESPFEIIDCFFSEPVRQSAESILARFSKWQSMQLRADDYRVYWFSNEYCWKNCFRLYRTSDHLGLEICARKLEEHTRMPAISLSQGCLSEIFTAEFPLKDSFKLLVSTWYFFRTVERFQK